MNRKPQVLLATAVAFLALCPGVARAQQEGVKEPVPHFNVISANPFLLLFEWANVEYERKISNSGTMGLNGSWVSLDEGDEDYLSLNVFYRYYPQAAALTGFYFGGRGGIYNVSDPDEEATVFGLGLEVGYNWLLGANRRFSVGLGIGASRLFGGDLEDSSAFLPTLRFPNIGVAF